MSVNMSSLAMAKATLRKELKSRLASMSSEERQRQSSVVTEKVLSSPWYEHSKRICIYLSMEEEVSTTSILEDMFKRGKSCFVPRYTKTDMEMLRLTSWQDFQSLPLTKWNIRQPSEKDERDEALSTGGLDLVLLPGLGFTSEGYRIGRGKGYYDRYLHKCIQSSKPPITIGLSFREQIVSSIPTEVNDVKLDHVFYDDS